ncbi:hypothetical protein CoNPh26_CDS0086 [Staphylococcus phage S-CoN_Ph26]|nr:hypothetical protein CoNPh26_CDS0086 [Staphylococcus phage S-CoN_Ph26]
MFFVRFNIEKGSSSIIILLPCLLLNLYDKKSIFFFKKYVLT